MLPADPSQLMLVNVLMTHLPALGTSLPSLGVGSVVYPGFSAAATIMSRISLLSNCLSLSLPQLAAKCAELQAIADAWSTHLAAALPPAFDSALIPNWASLPLAGASANLPSTIAASGAFTSVAQSVGATPSPQAVAGAPASVASALSPYFVPLVAGLGGALLLALIIVLYMCTCRSREGKVGLVVSVNSDPRGMPQQSGPRQMLAHQNPGRIDSFRSAPNMPLSVSVQQMPLRSGLQPAHSSLSHLYPAAPGRRFG